MSEEMTESEETTKKRMVSYHQKFKKLFEPTGDDPKKVAIFTHMYPDPDAVGAQVGVKWLLEKLFNLPCDLFFAGKIAHPQNMTMVNLLEIELKSIEQYVDSEYKHNIIVDATPLNAGTNGHKVDFDCIIDHHRIVLDSSYKGLYINMKAGSCCSQIYDLIKHYGLKFDADEDSDCKVATALMVGMTTDTENLMSDDTTDYEFNAWSELFPYRDPISLKQIVRYQKPKFWTDVKVESMKHSVITDRIGIVGLGLIPARHRDVVADMADEMSTWEEVKTSVAFALIDGHTVEGCVRSNDASISVNELCSLLGNHKNGSGGGKTGKGAYRYELGGAALDTAEDDIEDQQNTWELLDKRERKRILRLCKK